MKDSASRREFMRTAAISATSGLVSAAPLAAAQAPRAQSVPTSRGGRFRQMLQAGEPIVAAGVNDVPAGRLAEMAGIKMLFYGGSVASEIYGIPDTGMITMTELIAIYERFHDNVNIPLMADCDDLGGNPLSAYRNAKLFEKAGLSGLYFEDAPQHARVRYRKDLLTKEEMVANIRAARDATDLVLCVNTLAYLGIDSDAKTEEAIDRALAYGEAGADLLAFGLLPLEKSKQMAARVKKPLFTGNMGLGPNQIPVSRMKEAGILIGSFETPAIVQGAARRAFIELVSTGAMPESSKIAIARAERDAKLSREEEYEQLARKYGVIR